MNPTYIYHITHYHNLEKIIELGGLICVTQINDQKHGYQNIAYLDLQDRRATYRVPIEPCGTLHDYVPFYFAPRPPMLYALHNGKVEGYNQGQKPIIYLVSTAQKIEKESIPFCFTDGHGIMHFTEYYDDLKDLCNVDWNIMSEKYWADTVTDNDRKRRRMAEFLVYQFVPLSCFLGIGVYNEQYKSIIETILSKHNMPLKVKTKPNWYY